VPLEVRVRKIPKGQGSAFNTHRVSATVPIRRHRESFDREVLPRVH